MTKDKSQRDREITKQPENNVKNSCKYTTLITLNINIKFSSQKSGWIKHHHYQQQNKKYTAYKKLIVDIPCKWKPKENWESLAKIGFKTKL